MPKPTALQDYLTPAEFGERYGVSAITAWRWCVYGMRGRNGQVIRLKHTRFGKRIGIKPEWADVFFDALANAKLATYPVQHPVRNRDIVPLPPSHYAADEALSKAGM